MLLGFVKWIDVVGTLVTVVVSILIILIVLIQREKGGGLAGAFGGSGTVSTFGVQTTDVLVKFTWFLFIVWVIASLVIGVNAKGLNTVEPEPVAEKPADGQ